MNIKFNFKDKKKNPTEQVEGFIKDSLQDSGLEEVTVLSPESILGKGADYF
jgi:hypothetical protein